MPADCILEQFINFNVVGHFAFLFVADIALTTEDGLAVLLNQVNMTYC